MLQDIPRQPETDSFMILFNLSGKTPSTVAGIMAALFYMSATSALSAEESAPDTMQHEKADNSIQKPADQAHDTNSDKIPDPKQGNQIADSIASEQKSDQPTPILSIPPSLQEERIAENEGILTERDTDPASQPKSMDADSPANADTANTDIEESASGRHILQTGDTMMMRVFGHEDMSGELVVAEDGYLTVPLLGPIKASSKSVNNLREHIRQRLDAEYIVDPRVTLEIIGYEPFFILGQVVHPGSYDFEPGMDIRKAVALAGGFTSRARTSAMTITRKAGGQREQVEGSLDTTIRPGDTIEVRRRWF